MSKSQLDPIKDHIEVIQNWMNQYVKTVKPVSSSFIFSALKGKLPETLSEKHFQTAISYAVREGFIKGFCGKKGKFGGYIPASLNVEKEESPEVEEEDETTYGINIGNGISITGSELNWVINRPNGHNLYYSKLDLAIQRAAQLIIDSELKDISCDISDLKNTLIKLESKIIDQLTQIASDSMNKDKTQDSSA